MVSTGRLARVLATFALPAALILSFASAPASAGERSVITSPDADYFGRDIETLKDVGLDECQQACIDDATCKAFTYNTKARWCFKKATFGDLRAFEGAVAGRIVEASEAPAENVEDTRLAELVFVTKDQIDAARQLKGTIADEEMKGKLAVLLDKADKAADAGNHLEAIHRLREALRVAPARSDLWSRYSDEAILLPEDAKGRSDFLSEATPAAVVAYLGAADVPARVRALNSLANAFATSGDWASAIKALRYRLTLAEDATWRKALESWIAEHGFRVSDNSVDTESSTPRICVQFSAAINRGDPNIASYMKIDGGDQLEIEAEEQQMCAAGVEFGKRYHVILRKGLPAKAPEDSLIKTVELDVYVRDRDPSVRFLGKSYVLPRNPNATIPLVSVNVDTVDASVLRIGDRNLVNAVHADERFLSQLESWSVSEIRDREGSEIWTGKIDVRRETNKEVTTAVPVSELVGKLEPGVYALVAKAENDKSEYGADATQWFIVSDLGLSTISGNDGLHVVIRSLSSAKAVPEVALKLLALNNEVLGTATTDAEGYARFDPGLIRGSGGMAPSVLMATSGDDFAFIDLGKAAFDLTDRGVLGRDPPEPVDIFMTAERGVYRPGETVNLTVLARDPTVVATDAVPLTLVVKRPDGNEFLRRLVDDEGAGGRDLSFDLPGAAMRGTWQVEAYTDPKAKVLQLAKFKVEDFQPERIDFTVETDAKVLQSGESYDATVKASWLYGAPAAGLAIEGEVYVKPAAGIPSAPNYTFGLEGEEFTPVSEDVQSDGTDEDGNAAVTLVTPTFDPTTRPLEAAVHVRVLDTNGRPVERRMTLPVSNGDSRIGVDPLFDGSVDEGGNARFNVIVLDGDNQPAAASGLKWVLSKVNTNYQWYHGDGYWDYHAVKSTRRVADGRIDVTADKPVGIEAKVEWGEYRLEVTDPDGKLLPVSTNFEAGWYVASTAEETPDLLKISLDKPKYRIGDTIKAHIEARFTGIAVLQVVDDRLITMKSVEVPAGGATVDLPVTAEWGPGAYVTAMLIRPLDIAEKRMPSRALGLTWASVDPGDRVLGVTVDAPLEMRPESDLDVAVKVDGVRAGEDAFVTVAAVDVGILNMTGFAPPAPEDWYFAQRQLGVEFRDIYGQLIDTTIGALGQVRSGGDGGGISRLMGPPPTEKLVAYYQGVTKAGADGFVRASFKLPDFNGTVKVMAIAWSKSGVGHGAKDVLVRDPVVIQASLPNFLEPGDRSRLKLDFTNVQGPSGAYRLAVAPAGAFVGVEQPEKTRAITLADKGKASVLIPLTGLVPGDETITATLTGPDGTVLHKTLTLGVRDNAPEATRVSDIVLAPGTGQLKLDAGVVADFKPGTAYATVMVGAVAGIDLPGLVHELDKYPYGCSEQLTSRALPLVYLDDVILAAGLQDQAPVRERVQKAIELLLVNQGSDGSFGLWSPGSEDLWLNAYVTDFLTRAREKGYEVPTLAYDMAVSNLKNRVSYSADFTDGGQDVAYGLYVLARNGRASIGDLRYFAETKLDAFGTPLARAQLGAALALYGEKVKAADAFRSSVGLLGTTEDKARVWRADYGSALRDGAAILALASESKVGDIDYDALSRDIGRRYKAAKYTSTQEQAWMLLAAHAMLKDGIKPKLEIDGKPRDGVFSTRWGDGALTSAASVVRNVGSQPVNARVTVRGVPKTPEPAGGNGYELKRSYFDLDGNEVDPAAVPLGQRMIVVLDATSTESGWARLVVDDPLPAGFAIDNPSLVRAGEVPKLDWLSPMDTVAHSEYRTDRFVAAFDVKDDTTSWQFAYMVRAVAPGKFALPAATLTDMYRPENFARTGAGSVEVVGPVQ